MTFGGCAPPRFDRALILKPIRRGSGPVVTATIQRPRPLKWAEVTRLLGRSFHSCNTTELPWPLAL